MKSWSTLKYHDDQNDTGTRCLATAHFSQHGAWWGDDPDSDTAKGYQGNRLLYKPEDQEGCGNFSQAMLIFSLLLTRAETSNLKHWAVLPKDSLLYISVFAFIFIENTHFWL